MTVRKRGTTGTTVDLSTTPIPAGFFFPGSDPFAGSFALKSVELNSDMPGALGGADTIVERMLPTIPIEVRALRLVSCEPITITRTHPDGGSFDSDLPVQPKFVFVRESDGAVQIIDPASPVQFQGIGSGWAQVGLQFDPVQHGIVPLAPGITVDGNDDGALDDTTSGGVGFVPRVGFSGCEFTCEFNQENALLGAHGIATPGDTDEGGGGPPVGIANAGGGFAIGQTRFFQIINRDDPLASCMRALNTSQAVEVTFTP